MSPWGGGQDPWNNMDSWGEGADPWDNPRSGWNLSDNRWHDRYDAWGGGTDPWDNMDPLGPWNGSAPWGF